MGVATAPEFGFLRMTNPSASATFSVQAVNIGPTANVTLVPTDTTIGQPARNLPLTKTICPWNP
jgi:hypothetical protein